MTPVFLVNMARSSDRLAFMTRQIGDAFERIEAVSGNAVPPRFGVQFERAGDSLSPGEIGCYASHLIVAERIVGIGAHSAIVLEDDVALADGWRESAESAIARAPAGWDIIKLLDETRYRNTSVAELPCGRNLVRYFRVPFKTGAYALSYEGALKLLKPRSRLRPIDIDIRYCWIMDLDILGVFPPVATEDKSLGSTIASQGRPAVFSRRWKRPFLASVQERIHLARKLTAPDIVRMMLS